MFSPSHAQIHVDYRQAELRNALAAERLVQSARENLGSSVAENSAPPRRIVDLVTDALSGIGAAIAAAGRRPHHV